jgi:hypothetical protein
LIHYGPLQETKAHDSATHCLQMPKNGNSLWDDVGIARSSRRRGHMTWFLFSKVFYSTPVVAVPLILVILFTHALTAEADLVISPHLVALLPFSQPGTRELEEEQERGRA